MNQRPIEPIRYAPDGALFADGVVNRDALDRMAPQLESSRREVVEDDLNLLKADSIPTEKRPLDAAFFELPEKILAEHAEQGATSELGRILGIARDLGDQVDRVVVLGIGGSYMGARALLESCREPYWNELSRAERGGRPRMYFEGNNVDNDATQALLKLLGRGAGGSVDERWAIVVISKSGGTMETAVALRQFLAALREANGGDAARTAELVIPVTGKSGKLFDLANALNCCEPFYVPDGVGGRFSVLSPVGLVPAALLGIDVVRLLQGAAAMNKHFRTAPPAENVVLQYVGCCHLWEQNGAPIRILSAWSKALEAVGLWYDQLLAESLGKNELGATPLTVVNTRDLHSRAQQHQEGRRDKLITNLIVDHWHSDPLPIGQSEHNQDGLNDLADKTLPEMMQAAIAGTNQAYREEGRPVADIFLPAADEASLGQLLQMLMLATVVEGRLIGVNPYGQNGVEAYKRNMSKNLGRG